MAGKQLAGLLVARWIGELGVNGRVLDIGMAKPVFNKGQIGAGVEREKPRASSLAGFFGVCLGDTSL